MAKPNDMATAVVKLSGCGVGLVRGLPKFVRRFAMFLHAMILFWKGLLQLLIKLAVPSFFAPPDRQHPAVPTHDQTVEDASSYSSPLFYSFNSSLNSFSGSRNTSMDSLPSLISPSSSTYSSVMGDLTLDLPDDEDDELPPLDHVPLTPEDIKRWVELPLEERRKVANMHLAGQNWMSWTPPPSPRLLPRTLPAGIPAWREEWADFDLPPNPAYIPTSDDLRRWWFEMTEEDRARINRISTDGLNWRMWGVPAEKTPRDDGEVVTWSDIGPLVVAENDDDALSTTS